MVTFLVIRSRTDLRVPVVSVEVRVDLFGDVEPDSFNLRFGCIDELLSSCKLENVWSTSLLVSLNRGFLRELRVPFFD